MAVKKMNAMKVVGIGAGVAAGLAGALAGAYLMSGKANQKKVKAWVAKAKRDVARELKTLKRVSEKEYKAVVEKVMKRYGSLEDVSMAEVARAVAEVKKEWKHIQGKVKKIAKITAKKKPAKKPAKRPAHRKARK